MLVRSSIVPRNLHRRRLRGSLGLLAALGWLASACGDAPAPPPQRGTLSPADREAVRAESLRAAAVAARPATGRWDLDLVAERLVRAGVNPRATDTLPPLPDFLGAPQMGRFRIGRGIDLLVFIYPDSVARRAVTDALDPEKAAPPGQVSPFGLTPLMITSANLLAVLGGGSSTQRERVQLALEAGLPPAAAGDR
jgi:hypothetical protein